MRDTTTLLRVQLALGIVVKYEKWCPNLKHHLLIILEASFTIFIFYGTGRRTALQANT